MSDISDKLERMSPQALKQIVRLGQLHAKLTAKRNLTPTQAKILAKINRTRLGFG